MFFFNSLYINVYYKSLLFQIKYSSNNSIDKSYISSFLCSYNFSRYFDRPH